MSWVIFYATLLTATVGLIAYTAATGAPGAWLKLLLSLVPILTAFGQALLKTNLRVYLLWQQLWIRLHGNNTANWRFTVRLSGDLGKNALADLEARLKGQLPNWPVEVQSKSDISLRFKLDKTLHLHAMFDWPAFSADGLSHLTIRSDEIEVSYKSARDKLDRCITPFISRLVTFWPAAEHATSLEIEFSGKNPFFAFYVAHLSPAQVTKFNLVFRPLSLSRDQTDKVTVTSNSLQIDAASPESFNILSKAFILLSSEAAQFTKS